MGEYKVDKRVCVYPAYLNSTLTVREGRRIPAVLATENPSAHEVYESAMRLGFKCALEVSAALTLTPPACVRNPDERNVCRCAAIGWRRGCQLKAEAATDSGGR
jgi:signal recognition particle subunit SEC65